MWHLFIKFLLDDILVLRSRLHLAKLYLHCKIQLVAAWCLQLYRCKESKIFFCFKYYCNGLKVAILLTFLFSSPKKSLDNNQWFNTVLHSILMGGKRCSSNYFFVNLVLMNSPKKWPPLSHILFCRLKHVNLTLNIYHML